MVKRISYRDSGVDIQAGDDLIKRIRPYVRKTARKEVLGSLGGFGALVEILGYRNPVLVSGTDGVGTKLKLAQSWDLHQTIGVDLVAMCVNDILVYGAEPIFFLDYFACGKLEINKAEKVIAGIARGCELAGAALVGGETAEMPDMYPDDEYDLAGFAVGIVEKDNIISKDKVKEGDLLIGLHSSGVHSNGYSLVRKLIKEYEPNLDEIFDNDRSLRQVLMEPTRIYVKSVLPLIKKIHSIAHITGGGILGNLPRALPDGFGAEIQKHTLPKLKIFSQLAQWSSLSFEEMHATFNCGIGMILIVPAKNTEEIVESLKKSCKTASLIGKVLSNSGIVFK